MVLDPPEDSRFYDYQWPYSFTDLMYTCWSVYNKVSEVNFYYNGLPAGAKAACWISRIEALEELPLALESPALEAAGQRLMFPVALKPDEYAELDWAGRCRHFGPNGALLGEPQPQGSLRLPSGDSQVRFTCAPGAGNSPRAEVTIALRGCPLANARRGRPGDSFDRAGQTSSNFAVKCRRAAGSSTIRRPLSDSRRWKTSIVASIT